VTPEVSSFNNQIRRKRRRWVAQEAAPSVRGRGRSKEGEGDEEDES